METLIRDNGQVNVSALERMLSVFTGSALLVRSMRRRSIVSALISADLIRRGVSGHSYAYQLLGVSSTPSKNRRAVIPYRQGIRIDEAVTVGRTPSELYQFWRRFENLPSFMEHLVSVAPIDETQSHWVAKGPGGTTVEWDAEILSDAPDQMIGWRSLPGSDIDTAGSVHFTKAPGDRGTEVKVELQYLPPGGVLSALIAKLFGEEPEHQIREDLRHLKQILEAGEIPSVKGQPQGPGLLEATPTRKLPRKMRDAARGREDEEAVA